MKWILIWIIVGTSSGRPAVTSGTAEFLNERACRAVAEAIVRQKLGRFTDAVWADCFPDR